MSRHSIFIAAAIAAITFVSAPAPAREVASLFAGAKNLPVERVTASGGGDVRTTPQGVIITGPGGKHLLPVPFGPNFEKNLRRNLEGLAVHGEDPWCVVRLPPATSMSSLTTNTRKPARAGNCPQALTSHA